MRDTLALEDLCGVYAVPPLPRRHDGHRTLDLDAAEQVASHIDDGGITRFLYGGNAFLYHVSLDEFETLVDWLAEFLRPLADPEHRAVVRPRARPGPDPAAPRFPAVMMLPCGDPRDAPGCEPGCATSPTPRACRSSST